MNYSRIDLRTAAGIPLSLSNEFPNVHDVYDAVEDANDANDLVKRLTNMESYLKSITLERDSETTIRLKCIANMCNNVSYLTIKK